MHSDLLTCQSDAENKITSFKAALGDSLMTDQVIVQKFITHGTPHLFEKQDDKYFDLKHDIANHFRERPENVHMVGSAKLGFSIAPQKLWKPFDAESDIDMVVISEKIFKQFWHDLYDFNIALTSRTHIEETNYIKFLKYFFKGWIRPDLFPFNYPYKKEWRLFFQSISYNKYGPRKITCAIYYGLDFFEKYHIENIKKLRAGSI